MSPLSSLVKRNVKLFFKDKGLFFTSLITPVILLVLYSTFLGNVYRDSFKAGMPGVELSEKLLNGLVGSELLSSLLAVCCITVSFCSNMLMVQDKVTGARNDLTVTPVKSSALSLGYYIATLISSLSVCFVATVAGLIYVAMTGWYMSFADVLLIFADVVILVTFGTALSSIINMFLWSQGQISAVGTIVSSGYGFVCGAYMPISSFGEGLQKIVMCLPGTYGTGLIRNRCMRGAIEQLKAENVPAEAINELKDAIDCNLYFFGKRISTGAMLGVMAVTVILLISVYVLLDRSRKTK